ncbi:MAG: PucR family transcriptional regulator [Nocardioides sp.]
MDRPSPEDGETVALRWLLDRSELGLVPHHLPDAEVPLRWAHAIELDDPTPWLSGSGLVLTTGLRLPRTKQGQEAYVSRLADAGISALGIGTGLRFAAVPFAVVAACRAHGVALVEVPLPTPFLAIVQALTDRLAELRRLRLRDAVAAQQRLTRAAVRDGMPGLAAGLAAALRADVVLVSGDGTVLGRGGPGRLDPGAVLAAAAGATAVHESHRALELQPLGGAPGRPLGWLAVGSARPPTPWDRLLVTHTVSVATLELARPVAADMTGLGTVVLDALLGRRELTAAAALTGAELGSELALIGVRADTDVLDRAVADMRRQWPLLDAPLTDASGRLLLLAAHHAELLLGALSERVTAVAMRVGPARLVDALPVLRRHLDHAAAGTRRWLSPNPGELLSADPAVAAAAAPWVRALTEYDAAHDTGLVETLRTFLLHHGAADPTAEALGVHRHTVRHRVQRAAEVAGFDPTDATHRAVLLLGLGSPSRQADQRGGLAGWTRPVAPGDA